MWVRDKIFLKIALNYHLFCLVRVVIVHQTPNRLSEGPISVPTRDKEFFSYTSLESALGLTSSDWVFAQKTGEKAQYSVVENQYIIYSGLFAFSGFTILNSDIAPTFMTSKNIVTRVTSFLKIEC